MTKKTKPPVFTHGDFVLVRRHDKTVDVCDPVTATRQELIDYLEPWGYQCYDHETTQELRDCALANFDLEQS